MAVSKLDLENAKFDCLEALKSDPEVFNQEGLS